MPPTQEQPQHPAPSLSGAHATFPLQNATPAVSTLPASPKITHKRNPSPNGRSLKATDSNRTPRRVPEDDVSEGPTEYYAKFVAPHSSSEGEVATLEYERITRLERQLSTSLTAQTERDQQIAQLTAKLAVKSALHEQAEANAAEGVKRAGLELREHTDQLLVQTSLVKQRDIELKYMQARLSDIQAKLDELLLSRDQQIVEHEKELANMRAKLGSKESELEAIRSRLTDAEKDLIKSKSEADTLRAQAATGSVNRDEDKVTLRLMERMRALEGEVASKRWNEKSIEDMECRNEG